MVQLEPARVQLTTDSAPRWLADALWLLLKRCDVGSQGAYAMMQPTLLMLGFGSELDAQPQPVSTIPNLHPSFYRPDEQNRKHTRPKGASFDSTDRPLAIHRAFSHQDEDREMLFLWGQYLPRSWYDVRS